MDKSEKIVNSIIRDLKDRSGFCVLWDKIDDDVKIKIRKTWIGIIEKEDAKDVLKCPKCGVKSEMICSNCGG